MDNMFWMLYQVLGSLVAKGGPWGAEMLPQRWENRQGGKDLPTMEPIPRGFLANKGHHIHGNGALDVV